MQLRQRLWRLVQVGLIVLQAPVTATTGVDALGFTSTLLGEPEILAGPTGGNFDSPFHAFRLRRPDGTARLVGFNNNGDSYRVLDGDSLKDLVPGLPSIGSIGQPVGLNRSASIDALDHCGCWLQAAASLPADKPGLVRGWYHEEFKCDYAHNLYTNKSIAYAESHDGGVSFYKEQWPRNQIIQASGANTTATAARGQQVGEGDHSVVVVDSWLYLFFLEWDDTPDHPTGIGLARSAVVDGGVPGSWKKYHCPTGATCGFTSDGIGGSSSMVTNISGSAVTWRPTVSAARSGEVVEGPGEFISIGTRGPWHGTATFGHGARLAFARPTAGTPPVAFTQLAEPLIFADDESWSRSNASRELYAYDSVVADPNDPSSLWFYYTYLLPGGTFNERYFIRRTIELHQGDTSFRASRVTFTLLRGAARARGRDGDWWATTAVVPALEGEQYSRIAKVGALLVTGGTSRKRLIDCYIIQWDDHFVANEGECASPGTVNLRTLGFALDDSGAAAARHAGLATAALYRCFDNTTKNHAVSLSAGCEGRGRLEFSFGHIITME